MDNDVDYILTKRLKEYRGDTFNWMGENITQLDLIRHRHDKEINHFFDYDNLKEHEEYNSKEWHIRRILYFINHPDKITPLQIDNECINDNILPIPTIVDGNHRYLAAIYLKLNKISVSYAGRIDLLEYLQGKTDKIPI